MKNNKIICIFLIIIALLVSFCSSVYATEGTTEDTESEPSVFTFIDFNGTERSVPAFDEYITDYNHYVMAYIKTVDSYYIFPFNETFELQESSGSYKVFCDGSIFNYYLTLRSTDTSWSRGGSSVGGTTFNLSNEYSFIYSCSCVRSYSEDLNKGLTGTDGFFLSRQEILVPIVEKAPLEKVLEEIAEILPVVLMTIVGLIGLRKALAFLQRVLRRS